METGPETEQNEVEEKAILQEKWETANLQEKMEAGLDAATTMSAIFNAINDNALNDSSFNRMACGTAQGEFQMTSMERLKPILDNWLYLEGDGGEAAQERYAQEVTLLDEFPGDATRRKLDKMLRHYLGIEKVDGWM